MRRALRRRPGGCERGGRAVVRAAAAAAPAPERAGQAEPRRGGAAAVAPVGGLPRDAVVGVLGGGQLGRMMALAGAPMGVRVTVLDPAQPEAPAAVCAKQLVGDFKDAAAVQALAKEVDVVTVEIEHVDVDALDTLVAAGVDVQPTPQTIRLIQDKFVQKEHFAAHGVPLPEFMELSDDAALERAARDFGFPLMLKSKRDAYDGRGNAVARTAEELPAAVAALGGLERGLYAEKWAPFVKELACMVARGRDGELAVYDVVETTHEDSICKTVEAPAAVPRDVRERAKEVVSRAVASFDGAGIFGVELFLLADGSVLLNEVAPRPHNSGHHTIEACVCSQFEMHLRAVMGWPLGDPSLKVGASIMYNILGEADGEEGVTLAHELLGRALAVPGASIHWYEKPGSRIKRKMGHLTVVGKDLPECRERLGAALGKDAAGSKPTAARVGIIMGSDSDLPCMSAAAEALEEFGVECEVTVVSAHRTPDRMLEYARGAAERGVQVIIAGAGGAAHLPGMVAALTPLPVIGVPVPLKHLDGMDSMFSIVQMPKGVPCATVAVGNAANAGLLAVRILAASDPALLEKMEKYQLDMKHVVLDKADRLEAVGWRQYLDDKAAQA